MNGSDLSSLSRYTNGGQQRRRKYRHLLRGSKRYPPPMASGPDLLTQSPRNPRIGADLSSAPNLSLRDLRAMLSSLGGSRTWHQGVHCGAFAHPQALAPWPLSLRCRRAQGGLKLGFVLVRERGFQDAAACSLQLLQDFVRRRFSH